MLMTQSLLLLPLVVGFLFNVAATLSDHKIPQEGVESDFPSKDTMNCSEKVMEISHFDQTNHRLLSIL